MPLVFETFKPYAVFHAAAYKHVPLLEGQVREVIKNNALGTRIIADLAHETEVAKFVLISTDKAVNPSSLMGACKRVAEIYCQQLASRSRTNFITVRFGNVLGSAGSVIPRFQQQIRDGGPITITDKRMTRYFMSIPEASQLVVQSAAMCKGGEIYVLDMGKPIKIVQLAEDLVSLSGLPKESIEIEFTGVRPGEKLYEELYFDDEATLPTSHVKVRAAYAREFQNGGAASSINALIALADESSVDVKSAIVAIAGSFQALEDSEQLEKRRPADEIFR